MIRIRFERKPDVVGSMVLGEYVHVEESQDYIALESEKDWATQREGANRRLRDLFRETFLGCGEEPSLFSVIGLQTVTSCNMDCNFCPVNRKVYAGKMAFMSWALLKKIARELSDLKYDGQILLFTNNEPLLDRRLPAITALLRKACPESHIKVLTNGLLLSEGIITELFGAGLSCLVVNNYTDGCRLMPVVAKLIRQAHVYASQDIRVHVRQSAAKLTTRAGQAPNREAGSALGLFCALPFTDLTISHSGVVNQCCFDALVTTNVGSVSKATLVELWSSAGLEALRRDLMECRREVNALCAKCDFDGFRTPFHHSIKFTRDHLREERGVEDLRRRLGRQGAI